MSATTRPTGARRTKTADIAQGDVTGRCLDARGVWVRPQDITERDALRGQLVDDLVAKCLSASRQLSDLKAALFADLAAHVQLVGEAHGVRLEGVRGGVTLISLDGCRRVERVVSPRMRVGTDILAAEEIVQRLLADLTRDVDPLLRAIVDAMFRRDAAGQLSPSRLLDFIRQDLPDPRWRRAQAAVRRAIESDGQAVYFRAYARPDPYQPWQQIPLDFSRVPFECGVGGAP